MRGATREWRDGTDVRLCGDRVIRQLARGPRGFEAGILGRPDRIGTAGESIGGRDGADRAVQPWRVVCRDERGDRATRRLE